MVENLLHSITVVVAFGICIFAMANTMSGKMSFLRAMLPILFSTALVILMLFGVTNDPSTLSLISFTGVFTGACGLVKLFIYGKWLRENSIGDNQTV